MYISQRLGAGILGLITTVVVFSTDPMIAKVAPAEPEVSIIEVEEQVDTLEIEETLVLTEPEPVEVVDLENIEEEPDIFTEEEINLIALVTMAEAEGEPEEGQRLVIDTIINRMESSQFPNTIHKVVYQKNQFESMTNGRADRCYVMPKLVELVRDEMRHRTNTSVVYFRTRRYSSYGTPAFQVGHHYFSTL